ncbi:MAG: hypothetical protein KJ587_13240 [Alphaproteobacteria bacterium]|nr:hypothetical protein [Alphaproteobacteria bacterium]
MIDSKDGPARRQDQAARKKRGERQFCSGEFAAIAGMNGAFSEPDRRNCATIGANP